MELFEFDQRLRALASKECRPFLCEGSPLECTIFLVGLNPGTQTPFWPYWDNQRGCRKSQWLDDYKHREGRLGRTREYIEILFDALARFKCLETNLFSTWSKRLADLPAEYRKTHVFDFLVQTVKPKLLFVHGANAISYVERLANRDCLPRDEILSGIRIDGFKVDLYLRHHLSFQLSKVDCRSIGEQLRRHMTDLVSR